MGDILNIKKLSNNEIISLIKNNLSIISIGFDIDKDMLAKAISKVLIEKKVNNKEFIRALFTSIKDVKNIDYNTFKDKINELTHLTNVDIKCDLNIEKIIKTLPLKVQLRLTNTEIFIENNELNILAKKCMVNFIVQSISEISQAFKMLVNVMENQE